MSFDVDAALRRLKPEKRRRRLSLRTGPPATYLPLPAGPLLLDSCVYIDAGRNTLPALIRQLLARRPAFHCGVCLGELSFALGAMRPDDPRSAARRQFLRDMLRRIPAHRVLTPDGDIWVNAGILAGILVRIQDYGDAERRKLLNDCLILLTARKHGQTLVTANFADFDLAMQIVPDARAVFYAPQIPA